MGNENSREKSKKAIWEVFNDNDNDCVTHIANAKMTCKLILNHIKCNENEKAAECVEKIVKDLEKIGKERRIYYNCFQMLHSLVNIYSTEIDD